MEKPKRILVASMCMRHSLNAVQWGISLAKQYNSELFITHILHNPFGLEGWNLPLPSGKAIEDEFLKMLQDAKKTIQHQIETENTEGLSIHQSVIEGEPVNEICKFIAEKQIDLLVMIAHEQGHFEHLLYGHKIRELIRKMQCSIFLVRREMEYHPG